MARSSVETARILSEFYGEQFAGDFMESFRIDWNMMRLIVGSKRISNDLLQGIKSALLEEGYMLITCDNYFVIASENAFDDERLLPQRIAEQYIYLGSHDDIEGIEIDDEDDEEELSL